MWGHFVMLTLKSMHIISVQSWQYLKLGNSIHANIIKTSTVIMMMMISHRIMLIVSSGSCSFNLLISSFSAPIFSLPHSTSLVSDLTSLSYFSCSLYKSYWSDCSFMFFSASSIRVPPLLLRFVWHSELCRWSLWGYKKGRFSMAVRGIEGSSFIPRHLLLGVYMKNILTDRPKVGPTIFVARSVTCKYSNPLFFSFFDIFLFHHNCP